MAKKLTKKKSNSPFRWAGGKFYARKLILSCIPEHTHYCEPFTGGGSIFFAKEETAHNHLNDKDPELINCYIQIRDRVEDIITLLDGVPAEKELHTFYKKEYIATNNVERAFRYFYLNRVSYSGIMNMKNCYWGYGDKYSMQPHRWPDHLRTVSERLQGVVFSCEDFESVIDNSVDGSFLFVDPPYFNADQDKFYQHFFEMNDHVRLMECLRRNRNRVNFLITYDNSIEIRELYNWCESIEDKEWNYTISRTDDQKTGKKLEDGNKGSRYKGKEVFITNYHLQDIVGVKGKTFEKVSQTSLALD
jgi:DNA adenine methylase